MPADHGVPPTNHRPTASPSPCPSCSFVQLRANLISENALSLAQEGDTAAVSYAICHVSILVDPAAAAAASSAAAAAAQAAAAKQPPAKPAAATPAALAQAVGQGSVGRASSGQLAAGGSGGSSVGAGGSPPFPSPMEADAPASGAAGSAAADGTTLSASPPAPATAQQVLLLRGLLSCSSSSGPARFSFSSPSLPCQNDRPGRTFSLILLAGSPSRRSEVGQSEVRSSVVRHRRLRHDFKNRAVNRLAPRRFSWPPRLWTQAPLRPACCRLLLTARMCLGWNRRRQR